jgi:carbonic anhydrase
LVIPGFHEITPFLAGTFPAYIDVDNAFGPVDKLSQVNALVQMENMASYPFMAEGIKNRKTQIHAMWFDFYTGKDLYQV